MLSPWFLPRPCLHWCPRRVYWDYGARLEAQAGRWVLTCPQAVSGTVCPLVSVRPCACWVAVSYPPSALSAAARVLPPAVVSLPEAISGWLAADLHQGDTVQ